MKTRSSVIEERYRLLGEKVVSALHARYFDAYYCATSEEAVELALSLIAPRSTVAWGGSMSLAETGMLAALRSGEYILFDRDTAPPEEKATMMHKALSVDTYLMSSNAITEDGQLVNMDGNANRLAALLYGPKQVLVLAGMNKIVKTHADAVARVRTLAAPTNAQRFPIHTPCKQTGICADCTSPDCICAQMVTTRISRPAKRIKVILIGEDLGF